jgi:hypothetical protein
MTLKPHVGKAVGPARGAARLGNAALEAVAIGVIRLGHAEHTAQINEMALRAGAFGEIGS